MPSSLRLISWNVRQATGQRLLEQVAALAAWRPDLVALQEVRVGSIGPFQRGLATIGLSYFIDSFTLAADREQLQGPRSYGELLASRWPLDAVPPGTFDIPWPERVLSAQLASPWGAIELHTTYIPPGVSNGLRKVETLEGLYARLAVESTALRILCGDFNTPQEEWSDGQVVTWAQRRNAKGEVLLIASRGERWDRAERDVVCGLATYDLADVYRAVHGYAMTEFSWYWRGHGRRIGRRFDHIFASTKLEAAECQYLHVLRDAGLSDHAPFCAVFHP